MVGVLCSGCATKLPNSEGCLELTRDRAVCSRPFSEDSRRVPADQWRLERIGRISLSPEGYGEIIKFIEEQCAKFQNCVVEKVQNNVDAFSKRLGLRIVRRPVGSDSSIQAYQYQVEHYE